MFRYRESIGLDLSDGAARAVHVRRRFGLVYISACDSVPLSGRPDEDAELLRGLFQKHGWLNIPCVIGLSGESLMLRVMACPQTDAQAVKNFVEEQVEHLDSLSNSQAVMEYSVSRHRGAKPVVLIGMARMDTVLGELDYARRIGLDVVDLVPGPLALYNAVSYFAQWSFAPVACVDVGLDSTRVVIGEGDTLFFARRFLMGSRHLADETGPDRQRELFGADNDIDGAQPSESFEEWLAELDGCISFYASRFASGGRRLGRIVFSGMSDFKQEWLDRVESTCAAPAQRLSDLPRADRVARDPRFAVASGLGLSGIGRERVGLSLLPENLKEEYSLRWQVKYWLTAGLALVLAVLLVSLRLRANLQREAEILIEKREMVEQLERLQGDLAVLELENEELDTQLVSLRAAVENARLFETVLTAVSRSKHSADWITLIADSSSYFQEYISGSTVNADSTTGRQQERSSPIEPFSRIVVEGYTSLDDLSTVRKMIEQLRENEMIVAADLLPDDKIRSRPDVVDIWSGYGATRFAIEISLVTP